MAKIAWGTPTLIEGKLGVILEIGRQVRHLMILGSITSMLPVKDAAIVVLNLDFIGSIDFATGAIAFDATLIKSRILSLADRWRGCPAHRLGSECGPGASVGGLHPQFPIPRKLPLASADHHRLRQQQPERHADRLSGRHAQHGPGRRARDAVTPRVPRSHS